MSAPSASTESRASRSPHSSGREDPELYRMSVGDHLEELRSRLILSLVGFVVAFVACLFFGTGVVAAFCRPLYQVLKAHNVNPQLYYTDVGAPFMVWVHISLICAAVIAGPWMLYQFWRFIATGLYRHERRAVTRYLPMSIGLLVSGLAFVYFFVLPWTLDFFISANDWFPIPTQQSDTVSVDGELPTIRALEGDPANPAEGAMWYNRLEGKLKLHLGGHTNIVMIQPSALIAPHIELDDYIDMVVMMLVVFALAFQLPLVVMALVSIGIVEVDTLKSARRGVYMALLIVAAVITPGDVITATVALMFPLILLYELGIFLGARSLKRSAIA